MRRVVDTEMLPAGEVPPSSIRRVKAAPSRLNRSGLIAVPLAQPDNTSVLIGYDGKGLFRIAGPGDAAPGGGTFTTSFTGSMFTGQPVPPALDDEGRVRFGAQTSTGDVALYLAGLAPGGGAPTRLIGVGDEFEGGRPAFFDLQALDADAAGRIAFQSVYSEAFDFAGFVTDGGPVVRLAVEHGTVLNPGDIFLVLPLLAILGEGKVGYSVQLFDGSEMILAAPPGSTDDPVVLAAGGVPSPVGDVLNYRWRGPFGEVTGPRPTVLLPLGVSFISLLVDDGQVIAGPDTVRVEVRDTLPPSIAASAAPSLLWPPDGRLVDVRPIVQAADRCDPAPTVVLQDVTNSEASAGRCGPSIAGASEGTNDNQVSLRAERSGSGPGRTYTLTYRATDRSGNSAAAAATVTVPHDRRP
jgi:hypothetical protein